MTDIDAMPEEGKPLTTESLPLPDSCLQCLVIMARLHAIAADPEQVRHEFVKGSLMTPDELLLASRKLGLVAKLTRVDPARLATTPLPAIGLGEDGRYFILARVDTSNADLRVLIQDPQETRPEMLSGVALRSRWTGELFLFTSRASLAGEMARFDFSWFVPAIVKYRRLLLEVLIVSLVIQLFALITPLFFQVVMDKVLVHKGLATLDVIAVAFFVVVVFEVTLTSLRSYVFAHTSSRIDVELGARLFRHLLGLPIAYFQARRVGDSVARVRELENIRSFLTGNAITLVLDIAFSFVFLAVMLLYSPLLTLIVVISIPCYVAISLLVTPILRARLDEKFARGAENQAFLVETVSGIDTVKTMAVEPHWTRKWDKQLAGYVAAGFRTNSLGILAGGGVSLIGKLVTVATLWFGARQVISGELSVGQLVAFNMLAGQVSGPIMRLAQMWTDFQQVGVSMQRLGDILNTRVEMFGQKATLPALNGKVEFCDISFRYRPDSQDVLHHISATIEAGQVIGIVGRSGSGKSTLTRLVQRLYIPDRGRVLVDDVDLSVIDPSSLRRQIGVVLQENVLFNGTIRDNIALVDPGAPIDAVIRAAKLAGVHEFVSELPDGYDTMVGEHGTGLSGGQRQRVAIARALMRDPKILIFDEATSALDYESERIIQNNMRKICSGRTVIIIAHRLSAVRDADRIFVMEQGTIVEEGSHDTLVGVSGGRYAYLFSLQNGGGL